MYQPKCTSHNNRPILQKDCSGYKLLKKKKRKTIRLTKISQGLEVAYFTEKQCSLFCIGIGPNYLNSERTE